MTLAKSLLNNHDVEVWFIADKEWAAKLAKFDDRFKFGVVDYGHDPKENRLEKLVAELDDSLKLSPFERSAVSLWTSSLENNAVLEMDMKAGSYQDYCPPS